MLVAVSGGDGDAIQGCVQGAGLLKATRVPSAVERLLEAVKEFQGHAGLVWTASSVGFVWALDDGPVRKAEALAIELKGDENAVAGSDQFELGIGGHGGTVCGTVLLLMLCFSRGSWDSGKAVSCFGSRRSQVRVLLSRHRNDLLTGVVFRSHLRLLNAGS